MPVIGLRIQIGWQKANQLPETGPIETTATRRTEHP